MGIAEIMLVIVFGITGFGFSEHAITSAKKIKALESERLHAYGLAASESEKASLLRSDLEVEKSFSRDLMLLNGRYVRENADLRSQLRTIK